MLHRNGWTDIEADRLTYVSETSRTQLSYLTDRIQKFKSYLMTTSRILISVVLWKITPLAIPSYCVQVYRRMQLLVLLLR
jgi:hypothetical protein